MRKRVENDVAALVAMPPAQLRERWATLGDDPAPSVPAGLLRRLIAQRLQEKRYGRLPVLVARELERTAGTVAGEVKGATTPVLSPGTRLIREWNGKTIAVEVRVDGFWWQDRAYRSLSEIAREATGAHWSGPRFFGLRRRG
jgi:hypothetical protein